MTTPALPAWEEHGSGHTAVVLLHGVGGGRAIWRDTSAALAGAGFRAVAIDLPGYGESAPMGAPTMDDFVNAVVGVSRKVAAPRTVLLGHSMGGMIAQEVLARHPRAADALILACTSAAFGPPGGDWQDRFVAERLAPLDEGLGMPALAARLVPDLVSPDANPAARATAAGVMAAVPESTYRAALRIVAGFDRRAALARIAVPTLLIAAEHDRTAPPALMQRMADRIPGARLVCLPDAGHIANVEVADAFAGAVVSFLRATGTA